MAALDTDAKQGAEMRAMEYVIKRMKAQRSLAITLENILRRGLTSSKTEVDSMCHPPTYQIRFPYVLLIYL